MSFTTESQRRAMVVTYTKTTVYFRLFITSTCQRRRLKQNFADAIKKVPNTKQCQVLALQVEITLMVLLKRV